MAILPYCLAFTAQDKFTPKAQLQARHHHRSRPIITIARADPSAKPLKLHLSKVVLGLRTTPIAIRNSSLERRTPIWKDAQCHAVP
jgi:hypothetical protein